VLAVLARHGGVGTGAADVFVNVVGGVRVDEPGADLAIALAVAGAARGVAGDGEEASSPIAAFGEIGLTGELRSVAHHDRRAQEAAKFGLERLVTPETAPTLREALRLAIGPAAGASRRAA
jgi:DNA repair protein RadA/Sms